MKKKNSLGFTIIELAVALTIVALIVGGLAIPIGTRLAEQQYTDTQTSIDKAMEAIVGFAAQNRRLPCPDMRTAGSAADDRDGTEDSTINAGGLVTGCNAGTTGINSDAGAASWGDLPWRTLGLQPPSNQDAWNNRLRYAVFTPLVTQTPSAFACPPIAGIAQPPVAGLANMGCTTTIGGLAAQLDIRCASPSTPPAAAVPGCLNLPAANPFQVSNRAVFVIYSHGANGLGATNINDVNALTAAPTAVVPDQLANYPASEGGAAPSALRRQFVARARSSATSNSGEYDDVLSFMSSNAFAAKMLAAGVWP
jgi:type II secretory pathway pseudopilin PulG